MHEHFFNKINDVLEYIDMSTFTVFLGIALIVLVYFFINALEKKRGFSREKTNKFLILFGGALLITYLFAWFFDALFHYFENDEFEGGITFIAGFIGGVVSFVLLIYFLMKDERKNIYSILNLIIPGVILAHAIGRLGCFSVGCCYGIDAEGSIFGVYFPEGTNPYIDGIRVKIHPTQLYEAFFLFALFFIIKLKVFKKNEFSYYLIFYGIFRFILEVFFRGDSRGEIFGVAPSSILSVVMVLAGIGILLYLKYFNKQLKEVEEL
ncbi:MAG: prolipoprotein diacylglyceryl transferase family protein [Bacilli bacterium]